MKKVDVEKIVPNPDHWRKPLAYYKEYMSYVEAFNKAIDEKEIKNDVDMSRNDLPDVR